MRPQALLDGLDAVQARMGAGESDLGPLSEAWVKARQTVADGAASLLPGRASAPTLLAEWGIESATPLRIRVAAPEAKKMGRALVDVLSGREPSDPATVVVQLRARFGISEAPRVLKTLEVVAARVGLEIHTVGKGGRPSWLGATTLPPAVRWLARDPETGTWAALRVQDQQGAIDIVVPPKAGPIDALLDAMKRESPAAGPPPEPLAVQIRPAEFTGLEAALAAHLGLNHPKPAVREASADVLAACTGRWRAVAEHAFAAEARLTLSDGRPRITARATLTPAGVAAWTRATRPLPTAAGLARWRVGWNTAAFGPALGPTWIDETARCSAGHPVLAGLGALGLLPRVLPPRSLPQPPMLLALPWPTVDGGAAAIVDIDTIEGEPVPVIAAQLTGAGPKPKAPLGPDAVEVQRGDEVRWRAVGGVPVELAWRADRLRIGLGRDALREGPPSADAALLAVDIDAPALAARLRAAGEISPEVRALAAVGARFGRFMLRVHRAGAALRLEAGFDP